MGDPGENGERSGPAPAAPGVQPEFEVEAGESLTEEERAAAEWSSDAARTRLTTVRTSAQHWQSTLSTIVGLFGAATVLNADGAVRALAPYWNWLYGVLVVLSLVFAALALKLASQAGEPDRVSIPADIRRQVALRAQAFTTAWERLSRARLLAVPAVVLLILAMAVRWYGPQLPGAKTGAASAQTQELGRK